MLEGCGTLLGIALAFCLPRFASGWFSRIEGLFCRLAHRKALAVATVGITACLLRLAILPICPVPLPFVPDDFSFLLAADTFAHGHLTNPTPVMWTHFESIHITMTPSYMSMYFPSNGLVLAASQLLFGHPWFGLLITCSLMCAAICWMLQAWMPPTWALLGGGIAILRLGLFSYWINTYSGGGSIAALGGALVLGSLPRLRKTMQLRYGMLLALGIVLLATTRPYEGLLLCLAAAAYLAHWVIFGMNHSARLFIARQAVLPIALIVAAGAWMGHYDTRAFGSPTTLPYTVDRATYAMAPYYIWQSPRPEPLYRHVAMKRFYYDNELKAIDELHKPGGYLIADIVKTIRAFLFFAGFALLPAMFMLRRIFLDRRIRFLLLCIAIMCIGMSIQIFLIPHYLAPFTAVFYALGLQGMRHLRLFKTSPRSGSQPVGLAMVRYSVVLCLVMTGLRLAAAPLHLMASEWPASEWSGEWYGPDHFGETRAAVAAHLQSLPGKQLVLVRYSDRHNPLEEWVYNAADIDNSKVVWAREMDIANNVNIMHYYSDRKVWLVEPDATVPQATPYPAQQAAPDRISNQLTASIPVRMPNKIQ